MIASKGAVFEETFIHHMEMVTRHCVPATMMPDVQQLIELNYVSMGIV